MKRPITKEEILQYIGTDTSEEKTLETIQRLVDNKVLVEVTDPTTGSVGYLTHLEATKESQPTANIVQHLP